MANQRRVRTFVTLALCCFLVAAGNGCGGDDNKLPPITDVVSDTHRDTSGGEDTGAVDQVDGGDTSSLDQLGDSAETDGVADGDVVEDTMIIRGPAVEIVSHAEAQDFHSSSIVTRNRFTVVCAVSAGPDGERVDTTSVVISVIDQNERETVVPGQPTVAAERYAADFYLPEIANGALTLGCSASDLASPSITSRDTVRTYVDLGPAVTVLNPGDGQSYANQLNILFRVSPAPVAALDTEAAVDFDSVVAFVGTVALPGLTQDVFGNFGTTIEFDDTTLFPLPLEGLVTLTVRASNTRSDSPVERVSRVVFLADSQGANIELLAPVPGALVGGIFEVRARVTDPAGVDPTSVVATVAQTHEVALELAGDNEYTALFDGRDLDPNIVYPLLVVRAKDAVGNQSSTGQIIALDTRKPLIELDSCLVREFNDEHRCSAAFDPLGVDAPSDGDAVPQLVEFRVRTEDLGNGALVPSTGFVTLKAGVNSQTVTLYVLDDEDGALVVDTDGDGVCDEINPLLTPTSVPTSSQEAAVVDLAPVDPAGESFFYVAAGQPDNALGDPVFGASPAIDDFFCTPGGAIEAPKSVCEVSTPTTRVIQDEIDNVAVIYGIPPLSTNNCMGNGFDALGSNITPGWACVAARSVDNLGNIGISPPMRVCFYELSDAECDPKPAQLPDCTGVYDEVADQIVAGSACTWPARFEDYAWRNLRTDG